MSHIRKIVVQRLCSTCHVSFEHPLERPDLWTSRDGVWCCPACSTTPRFVATEDGSFGIEPMPGLLKSTYSRGVIEEIAVLQRQINEEMNAMTPQQRAQAARAQLEVIDQVNADHEGDDYTPHIPPDED